MTATGLPPREVDALTFKDLGRLVLHWRKCPPAHLEARMIRRLMMSYLGLEPDPDPRAPGPIVRRTRQDLEAMVAQMNAGARSR